MKTSEAITSNAMLDGGHQHLVYIMNMRYADRESQIYTIKTNHHLKP